MHNEANKNIHTNKKHKILDDTLHKNHQFHLCVPSWNKGGLAFCLSTCRCNYCIYCGSVSFVQKRINSYSIEAGLLTLLEESRLSEESSFASNTRGMLFDTLKGHVDPWRRVILSLCIEDGTISCSLILCIGFKSLTIRRPVDGFSLVFVG